MQERIHPRKYRSHIVLRKGFFPWCKLRADHALDAFYWRYDYVRRRVAGKDVIDVPCGMGWGTSMLRGCRSLMGIDLSAQAIEEATRRFGGSARFVVGSMARLNVPNRSVDLLCCLEGLEHVDEQTGVQFLRETARVLRPGGELILSSPHCPDRTHSGNRYHIREYGPEEIEGLLQADFEIVARAQRRSGKVVVSLFHARSRIRMNSAPAILHDIPFAPTTVLAYVARCRVPHSPLFSSKVKGEGTLYGTVYAWLVDYYLTGLKRAKVAEIRALLNYQNPETGYFVGPELTTWTPPRRAKHDREHLALHSTCTVLPLLRLYGIPPLYPLNFASAFLYEEHLQSWLDRIDWHEAWFEGNNLILVAQVLEHLRVVEERPEAATSLRQLLNWLDREADPRTGLWGTNGYCSDHRAMCGGYHQLLAYYHEERPVPYHRPLVNTVLGLQNLDGGFSPLREGGTCEDVDAVDILVNAYRRQNYRRADIRIALKRALVHILRCQNADGGFMNKRRTPFSHMGIPATECGPGQSNMFSTWFRVHTLGLIANVLPYHPALAGLSFSFNPTLSMGWHDGDPLGPYRRTWQHWAAECAAVRSHARVTSLWVKRRSANFRSGVRRKLLPNE